LINKEVEIFITGNAGQLQARYCEVDHAKAILLLCHPDPTQEGSMLNKVISTAHRTARDAQITTLRFNYRGVMQSSGMHDMNGGEIDDAKCCLNWLRAKHPNMPIILAGFSFGGFVAASLALRLSSQNIGINHLIMIAPAVGRLGFIKELPCFTDIIAPTADEILNPADLTTWARHLSSPHNLIAIDECGHFFHGKLIELKSVLTNIFNKL